MLVLTFLLKGGLYQITFRGLLRRVLVLALGGWYVSCALKSLLLNASLYSGAAASNVPLSQDSVLIRLLIELGSSRRMDGWWFDELLM